MGLGGKDGVKRNRILSLLINVAGKSMIKVILMKFFPSTNYIINRFVTT